MADYDDFIALLEQINAISPENTIVPDRPVEVVTKEAEALCIWVHTDKPLFDAINFDWSLVESLPQSLGALRYAEAVWSNRRIAQKDAQKEFAELRVVAEDLKDNALAAMDLAFFDYPYLIKAIQQIREGSTNADLVMDMPTIYDLGMKNRALLEAINFNIATLGEIAEIGARLGELLGAADVEKLSTCAEKVIRDKAYTNLTTAVEKIRRCGKYVCRDDEDRYKGYVSQYLRMVNRKARKQKKQEELQTVSTAN